MLVGISTSTMPSLSRPDLSYFSASGSASSAGTVLKVHDIEKSRAAYS